MKFQWSVAFVSTTLINVCSRLRTQLVHLVVSWCWLYQLRPIGKYVFEPSSNIMNRLEGSEWQKLFRTFQLEKVMRQKDDADFALLLNRVRKGKHTPSDIRILQNRTIKTTDPQYNRKALHIFVTNVQTNKHNNERLKELGQPIIMLIRREKNQHHYKITQFRIMLLIVADCLKH